MLTLGRDEQTKATQPHLKNTAITAHFFKSSAPTTTTLASPSPTSSSTALPPALAPITTNTITTTPAAASSYQPVNIGAHPAPLVEMKEVSTPPLISSTHDVICLDQDDDSHLSTPQPSAHVATTGVFISHTPKSTSIAPVTTSPAPLNVSTNKHPPQRPSSTSSSSKPSSTTPASGNSHINNSNNIGKSATGGTKKNATSKGTTTATADVGSVNKITSFFKK